MKSYLIPTFSVIIISTFFAFNTILGAPTQIAPSGNPLFVVQGPIGPDGPIGLTGDKGTTSTVIGPPGDKGPTSTVVGLTGDKGPIGPTGPQGLRAPTDSVTFDSTCFLSGKFEATCHITADLSAFPTYKYTTFANCGSGGDVSEVYTIYNPTLNPITNTDPTTGNSIITPPNALTCQCFGAANATCKMRFLRSY